MTITIKKLVLGFWICFFVAWLSESAALSQGGMIHDTREHILEDAKKEGKLVVSPGFEDSTTPHLIEAFKKKLDHLIEEKAVVDAFRPAPNLWSQYFSHNLFRNYDFKKMAEGGHLNIPREMIDESGVVIWSGSIIGIMVYNANRIA